MELQLGWSQIIVAAVQLGYSFFLKHYSSMQNRWIPLLNLGAAAAYFTVVTAAQHPEGGLVNAVITILVKAAETAVISTGVHSALKNVFEKPVEGE